VAPGEEAPPLAPPPRPIGASLRCVHTDLLRGVHTDLLRGVHTDLLRGVHTDLLRGAGRGEDIKGLLSGGSVAIRRRGGGIADFTPGYDLSAPSHTGPYRAGPLPWSPGAGER